MSQESLDSDYAGDGIYRENIIDHYKHPHNHGLIEHAHIKRTENNPFCGDAVTFTINIEKDKIKEVKFMGNGCAISQAAASILTDEIKNKNLAEVKNISMEDIVNMLGIEIGPVRTKCVVLGMVAIKEGIKEFEGKERNKHDKK